MLNKFLKLIQVNLIRDLLLETLADTYMQLDLFTLLGILTSCHKYCGRYPSQESCFFQSTIFSFFKRALLYLPALENG